MISSLLSLLLNIQCRLLNVKYRQLVLFAGEESETFGIVLYSDSLSGFVRKLRLSVW